MVLAVSETLRLVLDARRAGALVAQCTWHGAVPDRFMTHLAMVEVDDQGNPATWGEHVTDDEHNARPA